MKRFKLFLLLMISVLLAACSTSARFTGDPDRDDKDDVRRSGATPTTHPALETVNLIELLDPNASAEARYKLRDSAGKPPWKDLSYADRYDIIFAQFATNSPHAPLSVNQHRNLVQNRLMAASERRCGRFIQFMKKDSSDTNFRFAIASGLLSTAGALVPGLRAAQNLSGLSALSSGIRAEYNNEYYANLAVSVITRGIEEKRNELRSKIQAVQNRPYPDYDIAAAVTDAVKYDASCNIVNGLELANEAIQRLNEPGRDAMNRALLKNKLTSALASSDTNELTKLKTNLDALSIHTDALFNNFTHVAGISSGTTYQSVYNSGNNLAGGSSANAALTLGNMLGTLHTLETEATERVKASVSRGVTPSAATLTAAISAALQTLSVAISADFSGTGTTSCFTIAKEIAVELATKQSALELAKRASPEARNAQDGLDDAIGQAQKFAEKLLRYTQAAVEFKTERLKQLDAINEHATDGQKLIKTVLGDWTKEQLDKGIGDARRCSTKAAKEPSG